MFLQIPVSCNRGFRVLRELKGTTDSVQEVFKQSGSCCGNFRHVKCAFVKLVTKAAAYLHTNHKILPHSELLCGESQIINKKNISYQLCLSKNCVSTFIFQCLTGLLCPLKQQKGNLVPAIPGKY